VEIVKERKAVSEKNVECCALLVSSSWPPARVSAMAASVGSFVSIRFSDVARSQPGEGAAV
jgi:hypothetical protein